MWDVDPDGHFFTYHTSHQDFDLTGIFDRTLSVLIGADLEWSDGQIGTIVGTRATDKDGFFDEGTGDVMPAVAMADGGSFVMTWTHREDTQSDPDVWAQMFDTDGVASGTAFVVNTTLTGLQTESQIAMADDGRFVITWTADTYDEIRTIDVFGRMYDASGQALEVELSDSDLQIRAIQIDLVGNNSGLSGVLKIKVATAAAAPNAPALKPEKKYDTGRSDTDLITNNGQPVFTGNGAEAGSTLELYDSAGDDTLIGSAVATKSGTWTITLDEPLGVSLWSITVTDVAGNTSEIGAELEVEVIAA